MCIFMVRNTLTHIHLSPPNFLNIYKIYPRVSNHLYPSNLVKVEFYKGIPINLKKLMSILPSSKRIFCAMSLLYYHRPNIHIMIFNNIFTWRIRHFTFYARSLNIKNTMCLYITQMWEENLRNMSLVTLLTLLLNHGVEKATHTKRHHNISHATYTS